MGGTAPAFKVSKLAIPLLAATLGTASWAQEVVYTTFPGPSSGGPCFGDTRLSATGVQVPAGADLVLGEVMVRLHDVSTSPGTPFTVDLYDDDAGNPGTLIRSLGNGTGTRTSDATYDTYTVVTPANTVLEQGQTYWIVLSSSGPGDCEFGWSNGGTDPTGSTLDYVGERQGSPGSWNNRGDSFQQLELRTTANLAPAASVPLLGLPALLALSILAAGLGARRLKRG